MKDDEIPPVVDVRGLQLRQEEKMIMLTGDAARDVCDSALPLMCVHLL